jgi:hypothetical protein
VKSELIKNTDFRVSIAVFFLMILIQIIYVLFTNNFNFLFGVEYGNIAKSLLSGKGFSNPLPPLDTGPTAWVPPILVFLLSFGFLLFGKSLGAFIFLSLIKFTTYAVVFYFLVKTLRNSNLKINHPFLILVFLLYFLFSPRDNFESIHDFWIPQLLVIMFLYYSTKFYNSGYTAKLPLLIIIFITPLVNPSYALAFMAVLAVVLLIIPVLSTLKTKDPRLIYQNSKNGLTWFVTFCIAFLLSISLWTIRNYIVFEKFIPVKSNMWFEFYLANIVDSDGKLSQSALYKSHPIYCEPQRNEMAREGEIKWLEPYASKSHEYLKNNYKEYFIKVKNRLILAFIYTETDNDNIRSDNFHQFHETDQMKLKENGFITGQDWTTGFISDSKMEENLNKIHLTDKELIFNDWKEAKKAFIKKKYAIPDFVRGVFFGIIPLICIVFLILNSETRRNNLLIFTIIIYLVYLLPYILISHQIRYQRPLFVLQVILVYVVLNILLKRFFQKSEFANKLFAFNLNKTR